MSEYWRLILWVVLLMVNGLIFVFIPEWRWTMYPQLAFYSFSYYMSLGQELEKNAKRSN